MTKYIVRKKGWFGTLYVASPTYDLYPSTTRNVEGAYKFCNVEKAEKIARKLMGEVIEIKAKKKPSLVNLNGNEDEDDELCLNEIKAKVEDDDNDEEEMYDTDDTYMVEEIEEDMIDGGDDYGLSDFLDDED